MDIEVTLSRYYVRSYFLLLNEMLQFLFIPSIDTVEDILCCSSELSLR